MGSESERWRGVLLQRVYRLSKDLFSKCDRGIAWLYAQSHPENIIANATQNSTDVSCRVGTLSGSGERAYPVPDENPGYA